MSASDDGRVGGDSQADEEEDHAGDIRSSGEEDEGDEDDDDDGFVSGEEDVEGDEDGEGPGVDREGLSMDFIQNLFSAYSIHQFNGLSVPVLPLYQPDGHHDHDDDDDDADDAHDGMGLGDGRGHVPGGPVDLLPEDMERKCGTEDVAAGLNSVKSF